MGELLEIGTDGPVATLRLARPEKRNAINRELVTRIGAFFADPPAEVRAAVLTAEGTHFCAGLDLEEQSRRSAVETMAISRAWHRAFEAIELGRVPLVVALKGAVIGGGLELALAGHVRVADPSAFYALPEGRLGIFVGGGATVRVGRVLGPDRMREMMLTDRRIDAATGQQLGLSHELVEAGAADARALELAHQVAANAPVANQLILSALPRIDDMSRSDGFWAESLAAAVVQTDDDAREGLRAFLEKRPPRYGES
jgi:enoyl-CoA hydratase/carnithine racemase